MRVRDGMKLALGWVLVKYVILPATCVCGFMALPYLDGACRMDGKPSTKSAAIVVAPDPPPKVPKRKTKIARRKVKRVKVRVAASQPASRPVTVVDVPPLSE